MKTPGKPSARSKGPANAEPRPTSKKPNPKQQREEALAAARGAQPSELAAQLSPRKLALRLGIPAVIIWVIAFAISGWVPKVAAGALTIAAIVLVLWVMRFTRRSQAVAQIVRQADSAEARKEAIAKLETDFKKDDAAAVFAKAQLQLQEDPRAALRTLETIKLDKVMAPMADEARAQRAMIHLILGETDDARALVDAIDMARHKEPKTRATLAAIIGEGWARTGHAKKAIELLETFDLGDAAYADIKPQLLRARAFAYAWSNNMKQMKHALHGLASLNAQYLTGFITKKKNPMGVNPRGVHPALEKEAFEMLVRSGGVPRKMQFKRG